MEERIQAEEESGKLSKGDIFSLSFGALCLALIFLSPLIIDTTLVEAFQIILSELRPF